MVGIVLSENDNIDRVCIPLLLQPHLWFILILEVVFAAVSLLLNCGCVVASYYALPISFFQRRAFAMIALNYAFTASIILAKKCFLLFAIHYPCISVVSTVSCKLQEFPTVFAYIHAAILPLVLAVQCVGRRSARVSKQGSIDWTNACSVPQTTVVILCLGLSLMFTAFDQDFTRKLLLNCSIVVAIQQKDIAFWLITLLIIIHSVSALAWQLIGRSAAKQKHSPTSKEPSHRLSFRDVLLMESIMWLLALFFTGLVMVNQFVSIRECARCTIFAAELCFTFFPLLISFAHPILSAWLVGGVRRTCVDFFPLVGRFVPVQEMDTPPLPPPPTVPKSMVRILITKSDTPTIIRKHVVDVA